MNTESGIEPIHGEPTRFLVASDSGAEPYLVDLGAYDGHGECGCIHFQTRLKPKLEAGGADFTLAATTSCKHLSRAYRFFALDMVRSIDRNIQ